MSDKTILVVGASGVIGQAAIERLAREKAGRIIGVSRRPPDLSPGCEAEHLALDLLDADACRQAAGSLSDVTHVIYAALFEKPGLIAGWREQDQMATNLAMMENLMNPLCEQAQSLRHVSALQGTKAYGAHVHAMEVPARERQPRDRHENFYWLQEDFLKEKRDGADWTLTIWRPQVVFGTATGAAMNVIPVLAAYAALRRERGEPFIYPGRPGGVAEAVDADLIGRALLWAMDANTARDETFNITNGDVFTWKGVWPAIANAVGLEPAYREPFSLADWMMAQSDLWDEIVARENLRPLTMTQLCGESHHYADMLFGTTELRHAERPDPAAVRAPILVSTIKLRQAGFGDCEDSEDMFVRLMREMPARNIVPA